VPAEKKQTRHERYLERQKEKRRGAARNGGPQPDLMSDAPGADSKEKKEYLIAERVALELKERMSQLISRDFASQKFAEVLAVLDGAMEKIPTRVCHDLAAEKDPVKIRARLEDEIRDARTRAALDLVPDREQDLIEEPEPGAVKKDPRGRKKNASRIGGRASNAVTGTATRLSS